MSLSVLVYNASDLPKLGKFSSRDPIMVCTFRGTEKRTAVIDNSLNPVWDETLTWKCKNGVQNSEILKVQVFFHELLGKNRLAGYEDVQLYEAVSNGRQSVRTTLTGDNGEQLESAISLEITYTSPFDLRREGIRGDEHAGEDAGEDAGDDDSGGDGESDVEDEEHSSSDVTTDDAREDSGEDHIASRRRGGGAEHRRKSYSSTQLREKKAKNLSKAQRSDLPNKPIDFQVRVNIHEGRKLTGSGLNPATKVLCSGDVKETRVQKGTNNPDFNDVVFFNFRCRPVEMLNKLLEIKVVNSRKIIWDALVGSFKFDLGMVYDEPSHAFVHKWLLLTNPKDAAGGVKGYLKVSIQVIGPKDEPITLPEVMSDEAVDKHICSQQNSVVGQTLYPATMLGKNSGTLPYTFCPFENVQYLQSYVVIEQAKRFPSLCERIRIRLKDKDIIGKDDHIGTSYLNMSQISAPGDNGFLPTFGPCFINCYGSPREFTELPDKYEYLNKGLFEGVAYRGRVMVEVEMALGKLPAKKVEDIRITDRSSAVSFLRRSKYILYGTFFSATMINPKDHSVEFEVSIGNYGNKLDENSPAQSSTTPPSNPIYDGNAYYYIPWMEQKPCIQVESQWEDCSYRIESLNILISFVDSLEESLKIVQKKLKLEVGDLDEAWEDLREVLDNLSQLLDEELPSLPFQGITRLDRWIKTKRDDEWKQMRQDVYDMRMHLNDSMDKLMTNLEDLKFRVNALAVEPQNSIPDVIIWMLCGGKRVAVKRIPSHELMYSPTAIFRGKHCGKLQTIFLFPPAVEKQKELEDLKGHAQVRLLLWLGLEQYQDTWTENVVGEITTVAETNEACLFGRWGTVALTRPKWSDETGDIKQPPDAFELPPGWSWEGDWEKKPELSIAFEPDEGLDEWTEDIFEYQDRYPMGHWPGGSESYWADIRMDKLIEYGENNQESVLTRDDISAPEGWFWEDDWTVDHNRPVDGDGWEYTVQAAQKSWLPSEKNQHSSRRRRWIRQRIRDKDGKVISKKRKKREKAIEEGWEFARLANLNYHITEHKLDFARRRRWIRKLVCDQPGQRAVFNFLGKDKKKNKKKDIEDEDNYKQQVPRLYLSYKDYHTYQLRAYIYQARDMYASDKSGLSNPYAKVSFHRYSLTSRVIKSSVSPTWDQTLVIGEVKIYEEGSNIIGSPPPVVVHFYNKNRVGVDNYIGECSVIPTVRLTLDTPSPTLDWYDITRYTLPAGELLAAFELLVDEGGELPFYPPTASPPYKHYIVPSGIRPTLQKMRIEVLCWGVRDMKKYQLQRVKTPLLEMECGGVKIQTQHIDDAKENPNFPKPVISFDLYLPKEELYAPPLNICILDKRGFGREPMVGIHVVQSLKVFHVEPVLSPEQRAAIQAAAAITPGSPTSSVTAISMKDAENDTNQDPDSVDKSEFDWWSKYYYSIGDERRTQRLYREGNYDKMVIYSGELEDNFNRFEDLVQTFPLYRGKGDRDSEDRGHVVGYFKGSLKMYPIPDDGSPEPERVLTNIPSTDPVDVIVRVYVIRGIDLQPQDRNGRSDPYLKVSIGLNTINDKKNYQTATLNPMFGKMFELPARLPMDRTLKVTVMDWDRFSADDLIGETEIDLENRYLSQYRATCGLPATISRKGPSKWRDRKLPVEILDEWLRNHKYPAAEWSSDKNRAIIDGKSYTLEQFENNVVLHDDLSQNPEQRLALHILRQQNLVPEHIESRSLYNPLQPKIPQGKLQMWVDIFPKDTNIPNPVGVNLRKPEKYILRVVVWNTTDVVLDEISIVTGEAMSDIYVKGWLRGEDDTQRTDVHYRSMDGEGNFNWRLVFPLEYIPAENIMVVRKKEHFYSRTKSERHVPAILTMQIWDNDLFSPDDFLGTLDFHLNAMLEPAVTADECSLEQLDNPKQVSDLFKRKRMMGWWPAYEIDDQGNKLLNGKMELEFELITEEEAQLRPAGKGRKDPNMYPVLHPPNRPSTSFLWLTSPLKTFKYIIWKYYKFEIIGVALLILLALIIVVAVYTTPASLVEGILQKILPG